MGLHCAAYYFDKIIPHNYMISPCNGKCSLTAAEIMFPYHHNVQHLNGALFKDKSQLTACFLISVADVPK